MWAPKQIQRRGHSKFENYSSCACHPNLTSCRHALSYSIALLEAQMLAPTQAAQVPQQDEMTQWLLLRGCLLGVTCLDRPRPRWPRRPLRGSPSSSSGSFTSRPGEDRGSHPQDIQLPCKQQLQREGAECGKSPRHFADGQMWFVWHLPQTTGRRSESLERLLPWEVLLAKGDLYPLLSHRLVKAAAQQSPPNLGMAVQVQVSGGVCFFATSPREAGSCFSPGSCRTHQFSCK